MRTKADDLEELRWKHFEQFSIPKADLSWIYLNSESLNSFLKLKKDADAGKAEAQFTVGLCYERGAGIGQSYSSAAHYYELAAKEGYSIAEVSLAALYEKGLGVKQSYQKAFGYLNSAARKNDSAAQLHLGMLYEEGKGVEQS